jgi:pimeloyl-ACP methyl ester carboxylesterase
VNEAFFFGPADLQIFARYHPPTSGPGRVLTVICPPLFSEYDRTYKALRELAETLAAAGQHVLRFDFRGTGDSFGELETLAPGCWMEDIAIAVREGREISSSETVQLMGVRAGALLACRSMGISDEVQRLVLWDPILDGASYLKEMHRLQVELCDRQLYLGRTERRAAMREFAGHILSDQLVGELRSLDANSFGSVPEGKLHVVSTSSSSALPLPAVSRHLVPFRCDWGTASTDLLVPRPILEQLVECLTSS